MKAHGKPIAIILIGRYVQLLTSFANAFDIVMKFIVDDPRSPKLAKSQSEITTIEYSFFGTLTLGLMFFGFWSFWTALVVFFVLHIFNSLRYEILYNSNETDSFGSNLTDWR